MINLHEPLLWTQQGNFRKNRVAPPSVHKVHKHIQHHHYNLIHLIHQSLKLCNDLRETQGRIMYVLVFSLHCKKNIFLLLVFQYKYLNSLRSRYIYLRSRTTWCKISSIKIFIKICWSWFKNIKIFILENKTKIQNNTFFWQCMSTLVKFSSYISKNPKTRSIYLRSNTATDIKTFFQTTYL